MLGARRHHRRAARLDPVLQLRPWLRDPVMLLRVWEGGMSFHGGLLGVVIALWLYGRKLGRSFFEMTDFVAPLAPLGLAFGRLGNFINGELWGKPTDVPWGFVVNGVARHASQLYQAALEGVALFSSCGSFRRASGRAWLYRDCSPRLWRVPLPGGVRAPARRPHRLSGVRLAHHGPAAVPAADPARRGAAVARLPAGRGHA
jgi:hypothetical protein